MEVFSYSGFKVFTVSKTKKPIVSQGILKVIPDYDIKDAPAGKHRCFFWWQFGQVLRMIRDVIAWVKNRSRTTIFPCVPVLLFWEKQACSIINQRQLFIPALRLCDSEFPKTKVLSDVRFVDNGKVITTAGISAGIDGALHLVSKLKGEEVAKSTAFYMEYDKWVPEDGLIVGK